MTRDIERPLSLYDGQDRIGFVVDRGGGHVEAFDVSGVHLGTFKKIKAAANAVSSLSLRSCVGDQSARMDNSE
jgi:hypothetical protein